MHLRSVYREGWLCTVYEPSTAGQPNGLEETWGEAVLTPCPVVYEQTGRDPVGSASPPESSTTSTTIRTSSRTAGTTLTGGRCATSWWPTSTPACPTEVRTLKVIAPA